MRALVISVLLAATAGVHAQLAVTPPELVQARAALAAHHTQEARTLFATYEQAHREDARGPLGLGDADMSEHRLEQAEVDYRRAVGLDPQLWVAHKQLVLVEARLGRWSEFDGERTLLRLAREREAPGITARESDLIDTFDVRGHTWLVREYFVPVGRSQARYNFENFSSEGKVQEYLSLEPTAAAAQAIPRSDSVRIGAESPLVAAQTWSLNWYTGHGHGTVRSYPHEPTYEAVRADVRRYLAAHP